MSIVEAMGILAVVITTVLVIRFGVLNRVKRLEKLVFSQGQVIESTQDFLLSKDPEKSLSRLTELQDHREIPKKEHMRVEMTLTSDDLTEEDEN